jgi:hypothetical protein
MTHIMPPSAPRFMQPTARAGGSRGKWALQSFPHCLHCRCQVKILQQFLDDCWERQLKRAGIKNLKTIARRFYKLIVGATQPLRLSSVSCGGRCLAPTHDLFMFMRRIDIYLLAGYG